MTLTEKMELIDNFLSDHFGVVLLGWMEAGEVGPAQLSFAAKVREASIRQYLKGSCPSGENLVRLMVTLDVELEDLLVGLALVAKGTLSAPVPAPAEVGR